MIGQHNLKIASGARKCRKRYGRGDSSGHGSFSGRGCKGQNARSGGKRRPGFAGGQTPLVRLMPKFKGFKSPQKLTYQIVNVEALNQFEDGAAVTSEELFANKLISKKTLPVKILGGGKLEKKLTLRIHAVSKSAKEKIEANKGVVELI